MKRSLFALTLSLLLFGCVPPKTLPPPSLEAQARQWARAGEYSRAAWAFEKLARTSSEPKRSIYLLYAAKGYFLASNLSKARALFAQIRSPSLPPLHDLEYRLLEAELTLAEGDRLRARRLLAEIDPLKLTKGLRREYERLKAKTSAELPQKIALLLPWSSGAARAAQAIERGLLAMQRRPSRLPPSFFRYDSGTHPTSAYFKVEQQGLNLIIGPLLKPHIQKLAKVADGQPPVLALNRAVSHPPPNFYQFALLPEDEVEALTELAAGHGGQRALILVPDTPFGHRVARAFRHHWRRLGGEIVAEADYFPTASDFSLYLQRLGESDLVFLYAKPKVAVRLIPAIKAHREVPIYALAKIYSGRPDPWRDAILEGIYICDLPWILRSKMSGYPAKERFDDASGFELRLIAFGMDAYRIAEEMIIQGRQRLEGATGKLTLLKNGVIDRDPLCARFQGGAPKPLKR